MNYKLKEVIEETVVNNLISEIDRLKDYINTIDADLAGWGWEAANEVDYAKMEIDKISNTIDILSNGKSIPQDKSEDFVHPITMDRFKRQAIETLIDELSEEKVKYAIKVPTQEELEEANLPF